VRILLHPAHNLIFVIGHQGSIFVHDIETFSLARTDKESQAGYAVLKANVPRQVERKSVIPDRCFGENTQKMSPRKVRSVGYDFDQHKRRGRYMNTTKNWFNAKNRNLKNTDL
jgi:hypothetical protein